MDETLKNVSDQRNEWEEAMANAPEFEAKEPNNSETRTEALLDAVWDKELRGIKIEGYPDGCQNPFRGGCSVDEMCKFLNAAADIMEGKSNVDPEKTEMVEKSLDGILDYYANKPIETLSDQENREMYKEALSAVDAARYSIDNRLPSKWNSNECNWIQEAMDMNYDGPEKGIDWSMTSQFDRQIAGDMRKYLELHHSGKFVEGVENTIDVSEIEYSDPKRKAAEYLFWASKASRAKDFIVNRKYYLDNFEDGYPKEGSDRKWVYSAPEGRSWDELHP